MLILLYYCALCDYIQNSLFIIVTTMLPLILGKIKLKNSIGVSVSEYR